MTTETADSPATAHIEPDAFDQAMAEFANSDGATTADTGAGKPEEQSANSPLVEQALPPAQEAGSSLPPAGADVAPGGNPTDDVWNNVPEAARIAFEESQREIARLKGGVSGQARRANQLQRQLEQYQAGGRVEPTQTDGQKAGKPAANPLESERFKQFKDDYPELADPISATFSDMQQQIDRLTAPVKAFEEMHQAENAQAIIEAVAEKNPRWNAYVGDPRWDEFRDSQPRFVIEAMDRNWVSISDPDEAAFVVDRFEQFIGAAVSPTPTPAPSPTPTADPRRQRQLDAGRDAGASGAGASVTGIPDDYDVAMAAFTQKADAELSLKR